MARCQPGPAGQLLRTPELGHVADLRDIPANLIQLLVHAQVVNGVITPILLTYVLILATGDPCSAPQRTDRCFGWSPPGASR